MTYRWLLRTLDDPGVVARLQPRLNDLPAALTRALALRNVDSFESARDFFRASRSDLHDPLTMADMPRAAERVADAIEANETVLVYGDYDVDGTTATTICTHFLRQQGVEASFFIPDRYEDGYGLCKRGIDTAVERGASLIIALDCGITAHEEAAYAREQDLDLIICDHHTPKETLPDAYAVLDPKRTDCTYPFSELSGAGVGFKLLQATQRVRSANEDRVFDYLDLLGISIASDIVPMYGENRVLMEEGLAALRTTERVGLRALADAADLDLTAVKTTGNIVFTIGPRINAAGRMAHAHKAVDLLLEENPATARDQAEELEQLNKERRDLDERIRKEATRQAERQITARTNTHALVLYDPDWHLGVIGIVASRIVEQFYKPTIMLTRNGDAVKGSARSISGVNIYHALTDCEDVLTQFGGHDYAAGMSLPEENVQALRDRFNAAIAERITPELLTPTIKVDAHVDLETIGSADGRFWAVLQQFGPFGPSNPRPVFHIGPCTVARSPRTVGRDDAHLKFTVTPAASSHPQIDVIGFGHGEKLRLLKESQRSDTPVELVATVDENTWRGNTSIQLKLRDLRLYDESRTLQATPAAQQAS